MERTGFKPGLFLLFLQAFLEATTQRQPSYLLSLSLSLSLSLAIYIYLSLSLSLSLYVYIYIYT